MCVTITEPKLLDAVQGCSSGDTLCLTPVKGKSLLHGGSCGQTSRDARELRMQEEFFLVCISEMEKRVPGARLWCSLSPDHAFLGLHSLFLACQSDWKSSARQHRMPGLSWLLASFSKGHNLLLSSSSSFLFVVAFWRKSPWNCSPPLPRSSSLLCPLLPTPIEQAVPLVPSPGLTGASQSCLLPVALKRQRVAPGIRAECVAHAAPVPSVPCSASSGESVRLKLPFSAEKLY